MRSKLEVVRRGELEAYTKEFLIEKIIRMEKGIDLFDQLSRDIYVDEDYYEENIKGRRGL